MVKTHFIWDELSDNVLMETDELGAVQAEYTQEPGLYGSVVSQKRGNDTSYYHFDGQGSTRELTDENQNVTDTATYSAFGEEVAKTGTTENPWGYKGALGYYAGGSRADDIYVRARYMATSLGRWLSCDPRGHSDGPNTFTYVRGDPVNRVDATGLLSQVLVDNQLRIPRFEDCGRHFITTQWRLGPEDNVGREGGVIVQVVSRTRSNYLCRKDVKGPTICGDRPFDQLEVVPRENRNQARCGDAGDNARKATYIEAWPVDRNGAIGFGGLDIFAFGGCNPPCRGEVDRRGTAFYLDREAFGNGFEAFMNHFRVGQEGVDEAFLLPSLCLEGPVKNNIKELFPPPVPPLTTPSEPNFRNWAKKAKTSLSYKMVQAKYECCPTRNTNRVALTLNGVNIPVRNETP